MNLDDFNTEISSLLEKRYKQLDLTGLEKQFFAHLLQGGNDFSNIVMEKFPKIRLNEYLEIRKKTFDNVFILIDLVIEKLEQKKIKKGF